MITPFVIGFIVGACAMFSICAIAAFVHFFREEIGRQYEIYREQLTDAPDSDKEKPKAKKHGKKRKRKRPTRTGDK